MGRKHYSVYVIELSKDVLLESRFRKGNPDYVDGNSLKRVGQNMLNDFDLTKAKQGREKSDSVLNRRVREMLLDKVVPVRAGMFTGNGLGR
jgi:hypothetical protein